jgi:stage IV sporulation protein B
MRGEVGMNFSNEIKKRVVCLSAAVVMGISMLPVQAQAKQEKMLVPMGSTIGIRMFTDGVMVIGLSATQNGTAASPGAVAGLLPGDLITALGSNKIGSADDFKAEISKLNGDPISITVVRGGETLNLTLKPNMNGGNPELGLWLRDNVAGIGTLTFYDPETGVYGGLGHGINDMDSGTIMPLGRGSIFLSTVTEIKKGSPGAPGEICGDFEKQNTCGNILRNSQYGIFGTLCAGQPDPKKAIPAADNRDIELGKATVLANIRGTEVGAFEVEITRIYRGNEDSRSLMLSIKDTKLLDATGGIVQGMSGSPIIQNGKLIGAVTHVLVNDPTKGFGVSIDKMLNASSNLDLSDAA